MPLVQQPPAGIYSQQASTHSSAPSGSIGMVIVVLAVIMILGVVVGVVGRTCAGRRFSGNSKYDFEGWVERNCSTCIDGHLDGPGDGISPWLEGLRMEKTSLLKEINPSPLLHKVYSHK